MPVAIRATMSMANFSPGSAVCWASAASTTVRASGEGLRAAKLFQLSNGDKLTAVPGALGLTDPFLEGRLLTGQPYGAHRQHLTQECRLARAGQCQRPYPGTAARPWSLPALAS
ncbi:hypothetical protein GCM10010245_81630 [Streptomyces spectabilis]|nr:hypothetical protein GCM10010245_81630 [Streptomyces spectabilis]